MHRSYYFMNRTIGKNAWMLESRIRNEAIIFFVSSSATLNNKLTHIISFLLFVNVTMRKVNLANVIWRISFCLKISLEIYGMEP